MPVFSTILAGLPKIFGNDFGYIFAVSHNNNYSPFDSLMTESLKNLFNINSEDKVIRRNVVHDYSQDMQALECRSLLFYRKQALFRFDSF